MRAKEKKQGTNYFRANNWNLPVGTSGDNKCRYFGVAGGRWSDSLLIAAKVLYAGLKPVAITGRALGQ